MALLAAAVFALAAGIDFYRHRFVRSDSDLFRFLPQRDATVFYMNIAALRHAGILQWIGAGASIEESAYREFIRQTGFDYTKDLDAVAGSADATRIFFLIRGRFDWKKLQAYAGKCSAGICDLPGSSRDRWISFVEIQPDVMGLAIAADHRAAATLCTRQSQPGGFSQAPLWISFSHALLSNPGSLPLAFRLFAISLQSANSVVLSLEPNDSTSAPFKIELDARCANAAAADTVRHQLELDTRMMQLALAREHTARDPAGLSGLLTAGTFQATGTHVAGIWPVRGELLKALQ